MSYENKSLVELQKELKIFAGCEFINTRTDKKLDNFDEVAPTIESFSKMEHIAQYKIINKDNKDGIKLYLEDKKSWILVRPSGTEPLLRIYIESDLQDKIEEIKKAIL